MVADDKEEERIEISLRPTTFKEYIGQTHLKNNLKLAIEAVKKRKDGSTLDHILLYGPPGLGKTTMAGVIAHELGASLKVTSGPAIERAGDLASILTNLKMAIFCLLTRFIGYGGQLKKSCIQRWKITNWIL